MMNEGTYLGRVNDWGITKNKKGDPQVIIELMNEAGEKITWFGSFNGGAKLITIETLVKCGFRGDDLSVLADDEKTTALDKEKDILFNVADEFYNGKNYRKVKWISDPNETRGPKRMNKKEAGQDLASLNLKGILKEVQAEIKDTNGFDPDEKIPF